MGVASVARAEDGGLTVGGGVGGRVSNRGWDGGWGCGLDGGLLLLVKGGECRGEGRHWERVAREDTGRREETGRRDGKQGSRFEPLAI